MERVESDDVEHPFAVYAAVRNALVMPEEYVLRPAFVQRAAGCHGSREKETGRPTNPGRLTESSANKRR
jgi:hypothetical protein